MLVASLGLANCSSVPDAVNPVEWYRGVSGWFESDEGQEQRSQARAAAETAPPLPGSNQDYPNLSTVPERPRNVTPPEERNRVAGGLLADRENARYAQPEASRPLGASLGAPMAAPRTPVVTDPAGPSAETLEGLPLDSVPVTPVPRTSSRETSVPRSAVAEAPQPSARTAPAAPAPQPQLAAVAAPEVVPQVAAPAPASAMPPAAPPPQVASPVIPEAVPEAVPQIVQKVVPLEPLAPSPQPAVVAQPPQTIDRRASSIPNMSVFEQTYKAALAQQARGISGLTDQTAPSGVTPAVATAGTMPGAASAMPNIPSGNGLKTVAGTAIPRSFLVHFGGGSAEIGVADRAVLRDVAQLYKSTNGQLRIVGHTSASTSVKDALNQRIVNLRISLQRAEAVAAELVRLGVPRENMTVAGLSDNEPLYAETSQSAIAGNRRVEIFFGL